jgi:glycosyltransferase involved in cell wall biosynthesis
MAPPIVYDGLRLFLGGLSRTPRGVDRVDFSYARFLFENWPNECMGLLPTPWGIRLYGRDRALRMLTNVETSWREGQHVDGDPALADLRDWLAGAPAPARRTATPHGPGMLGRAWAFMRDNGVHLGKSAIDAAPKHAVYLNIGQLGWAAPVTTNWLRHRPDIKTVFMMHDVIPLHHPELVSDGGLLSQNWMLRTVLRKADGLITTTRAAGHAIMSTLHRHGLPPVPMRSLPLPVAEVFLRRDPPDEDLRRQCYFVVCGAIEPRKNHALLLKVWRRLIQRAGPRAPRLVVVGSPAHQGEQIVREIQQAADLRNHVTVVSGMASPSLRAVMGNARALLMPSLAEGFGLPVIEALAVGTPVLASDLLAHREAGEELVTYLDPTDEVPWFEAIMNIVENTDETSALRQRVSEYRPLTASDYFGSVGEFLSGFA